MSNYPKNSIYLCEPARTSTENPITHQHKMLILALVVERESGEILDAEINSVCDITTRFIRGLMVGHSLRTDLEKIAQEVQNRYYGASSGGLVSALRACAAKLEKHCPAK